MDLYGGFLNHFGAIMGVPPDHPFSWGFSMKFHEKKNIQLLGISHFWEPHMDNFDSLIDTSHNNTSLSLGVEKSISGPLSIGK